MLEIMPKVNTWVPEFLSRAQVEIILEQCKSQWEHKMDYLIIFQAVPYIDTLYVRSDEQDWQERDKGYVVRYPQTINDFCREAIYMRNCLLTYLEAFVNNDTTILFMRKTDDVNKPFITMEVYQGRLEQAFHRFNKPLHNDEREWLLDYCKRHDIKMGGFSYNWDHAFEEMPFA